MQMSKMGRMRQIALSGALALSMFVAGFFAFPQDADAACVDLYCEWVDQCRTAAPGWIDTYKAERCFTNCGYYWYWTGNKCCWTTQPGYC